MVLSLSIDERPDLPFLGIKRSGYGKGFQFGIEEFVNKKLIWVAPAHACVRAGRLT